MRIAILTYGEYRTAKHAVQSWNILNTENEIDVYVHTQNKSDDTPITEKDIRDLFPNVSQCKIWLEERDAFKFDEEPKDLHLNFRSYRFLYKKLQEYIESNNESYDFIIVNRLDTTFFVKNINEFLSKSLDEEILYVLNDTITFENSFIQDHFFMGHSKVVLSFLKNLPEPKLLKDSHSDFGKYILSCGFPFKHTDLLTCFHLRFSQIEYIKNIDFNTLPKNFFNILTELEKEHMAVVKTKNILVIGESCEDVFIYGKVERLSPEAPVPIIKPNQSVSNQGMAGNVVLNMKALGMMPNIITNSENIKKIRYVDESYNYILLRIDETDEVKKIEDLPDVTKFDVIIFVDYNKGFLSKKDILNLSSKSKLTFLDTKKKLGDWCKEIDFIKINYNEYLSSKKFINNNDWIREKLIVTRGPYGCDYNGINYPTKDVGVKDVAGAGDSFLAGLIFKYIQTNSIENSIQFANRCSTQVVQKKGVSVINKNML